jgi:DNA-binding CsgD family transcriptional regulator
MASLVAGERQRDSASAERVEQLSDRELEIFRLLGRGQSTSEIADILHINFKTVQAYCARAKEKLGLTTAVELRRAATRWEDAHAAATA